LHRHRLLIIAAVKDAIGQQIAYLYLEDEPQRQMSMKRLSRDEAIATRAAADIERYSPAAKFGQPGRLSGSINVRAFEMKEAAN
jgi:hypothetical protein